ncbi:MAG: hypothetical protein ACK2U3_10570 [Anaerolineales bacterium]|jgi:hypothetical protein
MKTPTAIEIREDTYQIDGSYYVCNNCGWLYLYISEKPVEMCPRCFSGMLTPISVKNLQDFQKNPVEKALPFQMQLVELSAAFRKFGSGIPFAPKDLTPGDLLQKVRKIYLPMFMVDTRVKAKWWAETGFDYGVVSHKARYDDNQREWTSKKVQEIRIRWEPRLGFLEREYNNVIAPALEEHNSIVSRIGDFRFNGNISKKVENLDDVYICLPNRKASDAWPDALADLQRVASEDCRKASGADQLRGFKWEPDFLNKEWTLLLLPIYSTFYSNEEGDLLPVMIQGQTGKIFGIRRASMKKAKRISLILIAFSAGLFLLSALILAGSITFPIFLVFSIIGFLFSILFCLGASIPVLLVWNFNRNKNLTEMNF